MEKYFERRREDHLKFLSLFGGEKSIELFELILSNAYKQGKLDQMTIELERGREKRKSLTTEQQEQLDEMIEGEIDEALIDNLKQ